MQYLYSDQYKFETWRKLWVILAKSECELGLAQVKPEDVDELAKNVSNIDFKLAAEEEKLRRHDVMAHVHLAHFTKSAI